MELLCGSLRLVLGDLNSSSNPPPAPPVNPACSPKHVAPIILAAVNQLMTFDRIEREGEEETQTPAQLIDFIVQGVSTV